MSRDWLSWAQDREERRKTRAGFSALALRAGCRARVCEGAEAEAQAGRRAGLWPSFQAREPQRVSSFMRVLFSPPGDRELRPPG